MFNTKTAESTPKPGTKGDTTAWLFDRKANAIVLHNRTAGTKSANEVGSRQWRSCVTGEVRGDK
jgi:hypothetical protein